MTYLIVMISINFSYEDMDKHSKKFVVYEYRFFFKIYYEKLRL